MLQKIFLKIFFAFIIYVTVINCAEIRFCENKNGKGECITTILDVTQKCVNLTKQKWASSINIISNCFRLYEKGDCEGKSLYATSRSPGHNDLEVIGMNKIISSIGKCFSVDVCPRSKRFRIKGNCPLVIEYLNIGFSSSLPKDTSNLTEPVIYYQTNQQNNRTEVMEALIDNSHINTGSEINSDLRSYVTDITGLKSDEAGQILTQRLGGSGTDKRNIFPQNKRVNNELWRNVEDRVVNVIKIYRKVRFIVNLHYNNINDMRPDFLIYRILGGYNNEFIDQGDVINPPEKLITPKKTAAYIIT